MKKIILWTAGLFVIGALTIAISLNSNSPGKQTHKNSLGQEHVMTVYKSPTCGCCSNWVGYMRAKGYKLDVIDTNDVESVKEQYGVPKDLYSCHTTIVNDGQYFVEGHIPEESTAKMLEENPDIKGIGMPGMPDGSPGMPGDKEPFNIMQVSKKGDMTLFEVI